jgi:hypothetical protein
VILPQLEISDGGTINATALKKITAGGDGVGLRTYDPGYVCKGTSAGARLALCPCRVQHRWQKL